MSNKLSSHTIETLWQRYFSALTDESEQHRSSQPLEGIQSHQFEANTLIAVKDTLCKHYLLVAQGRVRVQLVTESGREITLYHIQPGDGCILITACMISQQHFPAEGVTESEVIAFTLNDSAFNHHLNQTPAFRRFVFQNLGQRFTEILTRIDQICSPAVDQTLAAILLKLNQEQQPIVITHQDLAIEMGMARETISRHLKRFEKHGWIQLGRNTIVIKHAEELLKLTM